MEIPPFVQMAWRETILAATVRPPPPAPPSPAPSRLRTAYRLLYEPSSSAPRKGKAWTPPGPAFDLSILGFAFALGIAHLVA